MDLVQYNPIFADHQIRKYKGTCLTCNKESYTVKKCTRCWVAKYCDRVCQSKDFKSHKDVCVRISLFEKAKDKIDPELRDLMFQRAGYLGLSCFLGSLPDRTIYELLGQRVAVIVQILEVSVLETSITVRVRDVSNAEAHMIFCIKDPLQVLNILLLV
ncbi:hypothetical protein BgiBS90_028373, partial [Biomphalaria glabrata]